ncbi:MAG: glycosyltransferase family 2 protein [Holosporaceae bacterium]|jgi:glycosyltransferase involved in cell wall biosynthesis|nr:glycosyltransferase family 2 protein [Holosporaceae bacterium]
MKISVVVPCFNEEDNIIPISESIVKQFEEKLPNYDYELIFIDNCSEDRSRSKIEHLCNQNRNIKAIFNIRNFGQFNSPFYGICQANGDCVILVCADFQDPVELIPQFIKEWESGYKIVIGVKKQSDENKFMRLLRAAYYKIMKKIAYIDYIDQFTGFGLYDKSFISILKSLNDPMPFLRGLVAEFGGKRKEIAYRQSRRRSGKSSYNIYKLYDALMLSVTSYTKISIRIASFFGFFIATIDAIIGFYYFVRKIVSWDSFPLGMAPLVMGFFLFCSIILIFIGLLGEYILSINTRLLNRPLVIEEKRINF